MGEQSLLVAHGEHARQYANASLVLARTLTALETDTVRRSRKQRVLELRRRACEEAIGDGGKIDLASLKASGDMTRDQGATIVVDLAFSAPFAPYEHDTSETDFSKALHSTAAEMNFGRPFVDRVLQLKTESAASHATGFFSSPWTILTAASLLTAAALPLLPVLIGGAGGLAGAAATAHGLALLGGGSLAVGGFGIAGGTWVLTTLGVGAMGAGAAGAKGVLALVRDAPQKPSAWRSRSVRRRPCSEWRTDRGRVTR